MREPALAESAVHLATGRRVTNPHSCETRMVVRSIAPRVPHMLTRCPLGAPPEIKVHVIVDVRSRPTHPLGDAIATFIRREDAERSRS